MHNKQVIVLGVRGVPARHGGFETFAEFLSLYLTEHGWSVTVYCQEDGEGSSYESEWKGVKRIHIHTRSKGSVATVVFDLKSVIHSLQYKGVFLTLGYNTAIFNFLYRLIGKRNIINMDGIEWRRQKWGRMVRGWFWLNERFGCWFASHLVADHPCIARHLGSRVASKKITTIPYGGREILDADEAIIMSFGLTKDNYIIMIARAVPENSILEVVTAFSAQRRDAKLVILGDYQPDANMYQRKVIEAASEEVLFLGAIYDADKISALRFFSRAYVHGHQVGGTNPSLVEALGAGNAIIAHDNQFNRWVAKDAAIYFCNILSAGIAFNKIFSDDALIESLQSAARINHEEFFQWDDILKQYDKLLSKWHRQAYADQ